jgi:hypothetical protein
VLARYGSEKRERDQGAKRGKERKGKERDTQEVLMRRGELRNAAAACRKGDSEMHSIIRYT